MSTRGLWLRGLTAASTAGMLQLACGGANGGDLISARAGATSLGGASAGASGSSSTRGGSVASGGTGASSGGAAGSTLGGRSAQGGASSGGASLSGGATAGGIGNTSGGAGNTNGGANTAGSAGSSGAAGAGGANVCSSALSACRTTQGDNGLTCGTNAACAACLDPADDANCASAYGSGHICDAGDCAVGCRSNADCANGQACVMKTCGPCSSSTECGDGEVCSIDGGCVTGNCATSADCDARNGGGELCGGTTPYNCGACTSDQDCSGDPYYDDKGFVICVLGRCSASSCSSATTSACGNGDLCCLDQCVPSSAPKSGDTGCCSDGDCGAVIGKPNCVGNICTSCAAPLADAANDYVLFVNPNTPAGNRGTGVDNEGCAFNSVSRALEFVRSLASYARVTLYLTATTSADNGESFPLDFPENVTLSGAQVSGVDVTRSAQTVSVSAGARGAVVTQPGVNLSYLDFDGNAGGGRALSGVAVFGNLASASLDHLSVQNMSTDALTVGAVLASGNVGGALFLNDGVTILNNGTTGANGALDGDGLLVRGFGAAQIGDSGLSAPILFSQNADHAVAVVDSASISLFGAVTLAQTGPATGSVTLTKSGAANLYISQNDPTAPANDVHGLLSTSAGNGDGIHVLAGSHLILRNSVLLGNSATAGDGVRISARAGNDDVSRIDLGQPGDMGNNLLNVPSTSALGAANAAGICLNLRLASGAVLSAAGNLFTRASNGTSADCTAQSGPNVSARLSCSGGVAVGGIANADATSSVDVSSCSLQFR